MMNQKGSHGKKPHEPLGERQPAIEIHAKRLNAARRNPQLRRFLADAMAQERQLEREGLIHRPERS